MATSKEKVIVEIVVESKGTKAAMNKINKGLDDIKKSSRATANSLLFLRDALGLASAAVMVQKLGAAFIQTNIAVQRLEKGFNFVLGSAAAATQEMQFAREVSERLGLEYLSTAQALVGVTAAAQGSKMEGQATRDLFEQLVETMSRLGKSSEDIKGALKAVEQMFSKGKITAEEWRGQLGERLPRSMHILADAMGITTAEVDKLMEAGGIVAEDVLPKVTAQLQKMNGEGQRVEGLVQNWNRFKNAVVDATVAVDDAVGITDKLSIALGGLAKALDVVSSSSEDASSGTELMSSSVISLTTVLGPAVHAVLTLTGAYDQLAASKMAAAKVAGGAGAGKAATMAGAKTAAGGKMGLLPSGVVNEAAEKEFQQAITEEREQQKKYAYDELMARAKMRQIESGRSAGGGGGGGGGGGTSAAERNRQREEKKREADRKESLAFVRSLRGELDPLVAIQNDLGDTLTGLNTARQNNAINMAQQIELTKQVVAESAKEVAALGEVDGALVELSEAFGDELATAFSGIIAGTESVSDAFADMADNIAASVLKATVTDPIGGLIGTFAKSALSGLVPGLGTAVKASAKGNSFSGGTGLPHGVYSAPTTFPINGPSGRFANGVGLLGESGAEAVMPLKRGPGGKLGVSAEGGGGVNINIMNNAPGVDVSARQGITPGEIDIVVAKITTDVARGGPVSRAIEGTYALKRGRSTS